MKAREVYREILGGLNGGAPVEVIDSSSTAATFTSINGGTIYRYTQPLTSLTVSAMPEDTGEAVLIFSGGEVVNPAPVISAMLPVKKWNDNDWYFVDGSAALPLSATASGWQFAADSRVWCYATAGNWEGLEIAANMRIVSGSMTCVSSGGAYVVTAENLVFETVVESSYEEDGERHSSSVSSSAVASGLVASSTDGTTWTTNGGVTFPYIYGDLWDAGDESVSSGSGSAVSVTPALSVVPIQVALPASAGIVAMPDFKAGKHYILSLQAGIAVGTEFEVQS